MSSKNGWNSEQQTLEIVGGHRKLTNKTQPVLNTVAETAARLCDAVDAVILRVNGNLPSWVAQYEYIPTFPAFGIPLLISRSWPAGRHRIDRQTIHISHNILAELETEFPDARPLPEAQGTRTNLVAPVDTGRELPSRAISDS